MTNSLLLLFSGTGLAILDLIGYFVLGKTNLNQINYINGMTITLLIYTIQPFIMYKVLQMGGTVTILNLSWDCISSILVTLLGIFYFKDKISGLKIYGVMFSILAIFLFAVDDYNN
jgi:hypothetical protein